MRLLLIRHGQTPSNVAGRLDTDAPGPGLTELGERQADEVPQALAGDPIDAIYVSTLLRTQLTAAPLAADRGLEPIVLPGIHEIEAGSLEADTAEESVRTYLKTVFAWGTGDRDPRMPGGPDGHEFFERFDRDVAAIARDLSSDGLNADPAVVTAAAARRTAAVFSHGAAIRVWVAGSIINVPPSFAGDHELDNTGIVELEGSPAEGWTLLSWQGTPVGGAAFADPVAEDPTGETLADAD